MGLCVHHSLYVGPMSPDSSYYWTIFDHPASRANSPETSTRVTDMWGKENFIFGTEG